MGQGIGLSFIGVVVVVVISALSGCGGGGSSAPPAPPPSVSLSAGSTALVQGQSTTLSWTSNTGDSCTASGAWTGSQPASGSLDVTPAASGSITYTLTCSGSAYSGNASQSVTLAVAPASAYTATALVGDQAGSGAVSTDARLLNPWGIAFGPTSPVWLSNNHSQTSTLYDGNGVPQPLASPRVVALAPSAAAVDFDPTGIVFNASSDFVVSNATKSAAAPFIFDGEGGMIAGWAPSVDAGHAINVYTATDGAVYKGLAIANNGSGNFLYATDFHNNKIDVFDGKYQKQTPSATQFAFKDPTLPAGYAPFGIQAIKNGTGGTAQIYIAYASKTAPGDNDEAAGPGLGIVDVFDANGNFVKRLVGAGGKLNAPWGLALAPADFGTLSNALLVGNFGDGMINGFDATSGAYIGTVGNAGATPFATAGLWGIAFGNDAANQPHNTLFYAAGPGGEAHGAYGRIDLGATAPTLNAPPVVAVAAPAASAVVSGKVALSASVQSQVNVAKVEYFLNGSTSLGVATAAPYTVNWDTTTIADGAVTIKAVATDVDAHVGSSSLLAITVANTATVTLTQLQTQVFTPLCSGCHTGSSPASGPLPASQNLTSGNSYAALVGVASHEQPALLRVKPGDAANSYLIQKLQGTPGITGSQMPLGGPFLDAATIDRIKAWITSGAPNN